MTIAKTKEQLRYVLSDTDNKVIALTGKWGTGKTHLWNDINRESDDAYVKKALYASLFGLSSIDQVKRKLIETAITGSESHGDLMDGLTSFFKAGVNAASQYYPALSAINDLNLSLMAPKLFENKLIVIDDIERRHKKLGIDEILGFIDDYSQRHCTRFILLLNHDRLIAHRRQKVLWETLREKLIDQEIQLSTSAKEAFDIASTIWSSKYSEPLERACIACSLTNIRIIKKILKITNDVLGYRTLDEATLARVIPSIVLFSAIHYRGLEDGPDMQFALNVAQAHLSSAVKADTAEPDENQAKKSRWLSFMHGLGIYGCDEFEQHMVEYLDSGLLDKTQIACILDRYESETEHMVAKAAVRALVKKFYWDHRVNNDQLLQEAHELTDKVIYLNPYEITELQAVLEKLPHARALGEQMIDDWIAANPKKIAAAAGDDNPFNNPIHPKIQAKLDETKQDLQLSTTIVDACMHIFENSGWSTLQENVLRNASAKDFENAIRGIEDLDQFRRFMTRMMQMSQQPANYQCFGLATQRFMEGCQEIVNDPKSPRLAGIVRRVCGNAGAGL